MQSSPTYKLSNNLPTNSNMATGTTTASPNEDAHNESHEKPQRSFFGLIERPQHGCHPVIDWLTTVDHKRSASCMALRRLSSSSVDSSTHDPRSTLYAANDVVSARLYNQFMHGTTMIFLAVMPLNAVLQLLNDSTDRGERRRFPSAELVQLVVIRCRSSTDKPILVLEAFHGGWFGYALSGKAYNPGMGADFWILSLQILGVASLAASFNFITTILNMRAPGLTMMRLRSLRG